MMCIYMLSIKKCMSGLIINQISISWAIKGILGWWIGINTNRDKKAAGFLCIIVTTEPWSTGDQAPGTQGYLPINLRMTVVPKV